MTAPGIDAEKIFEKKTEAPLCWLCVIASGYAISRQHNIPIGLWPVPKIINKEKQDAGSFPKNDPGRWAISRCV